MVLCHGNESMEKTVDLMVCITLMLMKLPTTITWTDLDSGYVDNCMVLADVPKRCSCQRLCVIPIRRG